METQRESTTRLEGYDYAEPGAYFVTVVTAGRRCLFGEVREGRMWLSPAGRVVAYTWKGLPRRFDYLGVDAFIVMPNHFHGILWINEMSPGRQEQGVQRKFGHPLAGSLGTVIGQFKASVTRQLNGKYGVERVWQRNYYDRIIRDDRALENIRRYILANPLLWDEDEENSLYKPKPRPIGD